MDTVVFVEASKSKKIREAQPSTSVATIIPSAKYNGQIMTILLSDIDSASASMPSNEEANAILLYRFDENFGQDLGIGDRQVDPLAEDVRITEASHILS